MEANQASPVNFSFYFQASALALALSTGVRARVGELVRKRKEENHWHPLLQSSAYTCICVCLYVAFFKRLTTQNIVFFTDKQKNCKPKMKLLIVAFSISLASSVLGDVEVRPSGLKVDYVYKPGNKQF